MRFRIIFFILIMLSFSLSSIAQLELELAFPNLTFDKPVDLQNAGDGTNRLFVVEQGGRIIVFKKELETEQSNVFLDISSKVDSGGEKGLLGLAFHPNYENNGYFYINYTAPNPLRTTISRFRVSSDNHNTADSDSEMILLEILQPYVNHNAGQLQFGPDGYLYIGTGDGGSAGDPHNNAQDRTTLLGNMLRIDVDNHSDGRNYGIPPDNPYVGNTSGYYEEIYAYGLRNPWRFNFDSLTGELWVGDVGQNEWEEIDIVEKGKNYGWRIMEGNHCYNPVPCDTTGLELPIWEYSHDVGQSITGGLVYRGSRNPELYSNYVYADYSTGMIWALDYYNRSNPVQIDLLQADSYAITSFGVDENNELYICYHSNGKIYRFVSTEPTVTVSKINDFGGRSTTPGSTNVPFLQLSLVTNIETATISAVKVSFTNSSTAVDEDISSFDVYHDIDGNGTVSAEDTHLGSAIFINEIATVTGLSFDVTTTSKTLLLVLNIAVGANATHTVGLNLEDSTYITTSSGTVANINFPISNSSEQSLPVELASFTATLTTEGVMLCWHTESETNNLGFNIYRSNAKDGKYAKINTQMIQGAGTNASSDYYSFIDEKVMFGRTYYYYIENLDFSGKVNKYHILKVTVGLKKLFELIPKETVLLQNYPNPFNPETWIPYQLAKDANVDIKIYDANSKLVRILTLGRKDAGIYIKRDKAAYWDGRNETGEQVASGVYFYVLSMDDFKAVKKMIIQK